MPEIFHLSFSQAANPGNSIFSAGAGRSNFSFSGRRYLWISLITSAMEVLFSVFCFLFSVGRASGPADLKSRLGTAHLFSVAPAFQPVPHRRDACATIFYFIHPLSKLLLWNKEMPLAKFCRKIISISCLSMYVLNGFVVGA